MRLPPASLGIRPTLLAVSLCVALLWQATPVCAQKSSLPAEKAEAIRRAVQAEMAARNIPGLSVAVAEDFTLVWAEGFGKADLENGIAVKPATLFRLGSISKPITAAAVMQLAERGRLDLDAPIQKYVPDFPRKEWPITARELLSHTAGIRHYAGREIESTRHYTGMVESLAVFKDSDLLFEPGTRFSYSTYGYTLLGAVVEAASGARFMDYVKENVFAPAKMGATREDSVFDIIPGRTRGYRRGPGGAIENCGLADTSYKIPGGGMLSTPADVIRFAIAMQRGVLLKPDTVKQMFTPVRLHDGATAPYGLGWFVHETGGKKLVEHTGSQQGTATVLLTIPAEGLSVAVFSNLEGADIVPLAGKIAQIVEGQ